MRIVVGFAALIGVGCGRIAYRAPDASPDVRPDAAMDATDASLLADVPSDAEPPDGSADASVDAALADSRLDAELDAGIDGGRDAELDAGIDGGRDAGLDAGIDGGRDAGLDAGVDGGRDAGLDAGVDGGRDAGLDAGVDGGRDAGLDAGADAESRVVFTVTTTSPSGAGSLAETIERLSATCPPRGALVRFAMPPSELRTASLGMYFDVPLPGGLWAITCPNIEVDGLSQVATTGETNPMSVVPPGGTVGALSSPHLGTPRPEVFLRGTVSAQADNVFVHHLGANAITSNTSGSSLVIDACLLGMEPASTSGVTTGNVYRLYSDGANTIVRRSTFYAASGASGLGVVTVRRGPFTLSDSYVDGVPTDDLVHFSSAGGSLAGITLLRNVLVAQGGEVAIEAAGGTYAIDENTIAGASMEARFSNSASGRVATSRFGLGTTVAPTGVVIAPASTVTVTRSEFAARIGMAIDLSGSLTADGRDGPGSACGAVAGRGNMGLGPPVATASCPAVVCTISGTACPGAIVEIFRSAGGRPGGFVRDIVADASGMFVVSGLTGGMAYVVTASNASGTSEEASVP